MRVTVSGIEFEIGEDGELLCPKCGANDWQAWYMSAESQDCALVVDESGTLDVDYQGNTQGEPDTDDSYHCGRCDFEFPAPGGPSEAQRMKAFAHDILAVLYADGPDTEWSADTLQLIAAAVERHGLLPTQPAAQE